MKRSAVLLALVAVVLPGCSDGSNSAERLLGTAVDGLDDVRSGSLRLEVAAAPSSADDREVGFRVEGPFALAREKGALPTVRFAYTDLLGDRSQSAVFTSTADRATVTRAGNTFEVADDDVAHLRGRAEAADDLLRLHVDEWARSPRFGSPGRLDSSSVRRIVAEVDAAAALGDVVRVAADVGAQPRSVDPLEGDDAERLQRSVRTSRLEVLVDEHEVVRRVRMALTFGPRANGDLARILGRLAGVHLAVEVDLDEVSLSSRDTT